MEKTCTEHMRLENMRILIADPDFRTRQAFELLLESRLSVRSVNEAWDRASLERQLAAAPPDLILLDRDLPDLPVGQIATLAACPTTPLVLMSVDPDDQAIARMVGAAFIYKGAMPEEVLATLRALLPR